MKMLFALAAFLTLAGTLTAQDLKKEQFDLAGPVRKSVNDIDNVITQLEAIKSQLKALEKQIPKDGVVADTPPVIKAPSFVANPAPIVAGAVFQDSGVWKKKSEDAGNDWIWDGKNWFRYITFDAPIQTTYQYPAIKLGPVMDCSNGTCKIRR